MRFGLDAIPLTETRTGIGHYTFELARALAALSPPDEFELDYPARYPPLEFAPDELPLPSNLKAVRVPVGALGRRWWAAGLPSYINRARLTLFHGTNYDVPLFGKCPSVLTIHDLSTLLHPGFHEARRVRRSRLRLPLMTRRAALVITVSESVRHEVCEHLRLAPERVVAVPSAARSCFYPATPAEIEEVRRRHGIGDEFVLAVGTIEPRKNLTALLHAFEDVVRHHPSRSLQLVIAGTKGWLTDDFFARLRTSAVNERLRLTGYVSDAELRALYSACRIFVYPSLYEGFGLPPLEAMACGAPVIAGRTPAVAEVTREAARLVAPTDTHALAHAILELLDDADARAHLSATGRRRAAQFTWERTARMTLDVYHEALRRKSRERL